MGQGIVYFIDTKGGNLIWTRCVQKKKIQGFTHVFTLENFKKSLFGRHEAVVESSLASSSSLSSWSSL
jgi:hypothetical protein